MTAEPPILRDLTADDRPLWDELWRAYCSFYRIALPDAVTEATWARLMDPAVALYGYLAETGEQGMAGQGIRGQVVGFAHIVLHPGTWSTGSSCYLEDLYVAPTARGQGVGHGLISHLISLGKARGWSHLYWVTEKDNAPARRLYDRFLAADDYVRYRLRLTSDS